MSVAEFEEILASEPDGIRMQILEELLLSRTNGRSEKDSTLGPNGRKRDGR